MSSPIPTLGAASYAFAPPNANLGIGNVVGAERLAEKTIELTTCAQLGALFGTQMVWFGLTQAQERQYGFDAATQLGGRAFIIQFKASSTVPQSGAYVGQRRFGCQHQQMDRLVTIFGSQPRSCFYFLPDVGTFNELSARSGDLIGCSYLLDVADLPNPVPATDRKSGYHYVYLDNATPSATLTSQPTEVKVFRALDLARQFRTGNFDTLVRSEDLLRLTHKLNADDSRSTDLFYKNAALAVLPEAV